MLPDEPTEKTEYSPNLDFYTTGEMALLIAIFNSISDCSKCEHAIFCPLWGRYECTKHKNSTFDCDRFEKAKTSPYAKKCHCDDCAAMGVLNDYD